MVKKWFKYKVEISMMIVILMFLTGIKYDMFFHPEKHKVLFGLFLVLFAIAQIPYIFKDKYNANK